MPQNPAGSVYVPRLARTGEPGLKTPSQYDDEAQARKALEQEQQLRAMTVSMAVEAQKEKLKEQRQKQEEDAWIQSAVPQFTDPQTGKPDWEAVAAHAYKSGRPKAGQAVETWLNGEREKTTKSRLGFLQNEKLEHDLGSVLLDRINDDVSFQATLPKIQQVDPELAQILGPTFDPVRLAAIRKSAKDKATRNEEIALMYGSNPRQGVLADLLDSTPEDVEQTWSGVELYWGPQVTAQMKQQVGDATTPEGKARIQALLGDQKQTGGPTSDYSRALERYAKEKGKTADQLTFTEELEARKKYGQSDDAARRPLAPIVIQTAQGQMVTTGSDRQNVAPILGPDGKPLPQAPTTAQRDRVASAQRAVQFLDLAENLSNRINTDKGLSAKLRGSWRELQAKANLDDDVAEYVSLIELFTPLLARAAGHTGVLTEPDYLHTIQSLPKPGDSATLSRRKMNNLRTLVGGGGAAPAVNPLSDTPTKAPPDQSGNWKWDKTKQDWVKR